MIAGEGSGFALPEILCENSCANGKTKLLTSCSWYIQNVTGLYFSCDGL